MVDRYTTKKHDACDGQGCEDCDYDGDVVDRFRTDTEMIREHVKQAEACYHAAKDSDRGSYWLSRGDRHMQLATQYAAIVQAEAMRTIASVLEAMPDELTESVQVWGAVQS